MKKTLLVLMGMFLFSTFFYAQNVVDPAPVIPEPVIFEGVEEVEGGDGESEDEEPDVDDDEIGNYGPKGPYGCPPVWHLRYKLLYSGSHSTFVITLKDFLGSEAYSTVVSSAEVQTTLPSTLSGDYKIELVVGNLRYFGWITL